MPPRVVRVTTPVRVADVGGWTDTWFGGPGRVCHLSVGPAVTVRAASRDDSVVRLHEPDLGLSVEWESPPGADPLLEAAIGDTRGVDVEVTSSVPPGASLGTSASVVVAVLASLDALAGRAFDPASLATRAHEVETADLGLESGVQDQWAAATGGVGLLEVDPYPSVVRTEVPLGCDLDGLLVTVVFGPHSSDLVHREVIATLDRSGRRELGTLAGLATTAAEALAAGDLAAWAAVLTEATLAQGRLHPGLVGPAHAAAIDVARRHGALGWKVNGAGGTGGSLTVVAPDPARAEVLAAELSALDVTWLFPSLSVSDGPTVETFDPGG